MGAIGNAKEESAEQIRSGENSEQHSFGTEPFPPKLKRWQLVILVASYMAFCLAVVYLIEQFCSIHPLSWLCARIPLLQEVCRPCVWGTYIAFGFMATILIIHHWVWKGTIEHRARLVDYSEVESMIIEAHTTERRLTDPRRKAERL